MSAFTLADMQYIADLARLEFDPASAEALTRDFQNILAYVEQLNALDTAGVEPMMHAMAMTNVFREDVAEAPLTPEQMFQNAPQHDGECFLVPKILEGTE